MTCFKKNIFVFTKHSRKGASSRVRFFNYLKYFPSHYHFEHSSLFNEEYLEQFYSTGLKSKKLTIICYLNRFFVFFKVLFSRNIDIVWIEKELFPYIPIPFEVLLRLVGKKVVFDYDDAVFHNYNIPFFSWFYKLKFYLIARTANCIFVGNDYLKEYFCRLGSKVVVEVPTVISTEKYKDFLLPNNGCNGDYPIKIVWIGTPSTQKYLNLVDKAITRLQSKYALELILIGASNQCSDLTCKYIVKSWSEADEVRLLSVGDIGIMPVFNNDFEKGKCGYKLLQYMALGMPVVASPVGVNIELVKGCGYVASNEDEWYSLLEKLVINHNDRKSLGQYGADKVYGHYTYEHQSQVIISSLDSL